MSATFAGIFTKTFKNDSFEINDDGPGLDRDRNFHEPIAPEGAVCSGRNPVDMRNFGISLTGGFHTAWKEADAKPEILDSESSATMGILASYSWRFLANKRLILSPVIGAKKAFSNDFAVSPLMKLYPEVKINFGYVF